MKHRFLTSFLALSITLSLLAIPALFNVVNAQTIFSDAFENGSLNNWILIGGASAVTNPVHSGNYAANFSYATAACYGTRAIPATNTLNYTYYMYFGALPTNYICVVMAEDANQNQVYYRVQNVNGNYQWIFDVANGTVVSDSAISAQTGQWYKIQLLAITGSNSTFYFLVNDALMATITNQTFGPITQLRIGNDWIDFGGYMPQGETYFDDVLATDSITQNFISASAGDGGSINPSGDVDVALAGSQTFTVNANANHHIVDVLVDGVSIGPVTTYTFQNVHSIHSIFASFAFTTYTISASTTSGGAISPSGAITVNSGTDQNFTITPTTGYHLTGVQVDGASVGAMTTYSFTNVQTSHMITATFAINTYAITVNAGANGAISPGSLTANYGDSVIFQITPNIGYHIADVTVNGNSVGAVNAYTLTNIQAQYTFTASFVANPIPTQTPTSTIIPNPSNNAPAHTPTPKNSSTPIPMQSQTPAATATPKVQQSTYNHPDYISIAIVAALLIAGITLLAFYVRKKRTVQFI